ncbi:AAA family ATPase [Rothia mucilaginosa]|uniref:AAA family ATPase n=1 Tax=Rothia mucilaginosa TaxID=43675 RepID=UPI003C7165B2
MMYIKRIELENIRCFSGKEEIFLSPGLNYLVGENNSGKSSILHALDYLKSFSSRDESKIYTNNTDCSKVIIDIAGDDLEDILREESLNKLIPYLFDDGKGDNKILRVRRQSQEESIEQNGRSVKIDSKKVAFWRQGEKPEEGRYENVTGIDAAPKKLFDFNFIYADETPSEHANMATTKTLGKLVAECVSDITKHQLWEKFNKAHAELFVRDSEGSVQNALADLEGELNELLFDQYAKDIRAKFMFDMPDASSFLKSGRVVMSNGDNGDDETSLENKGTGLQRAFMIALLQVYAKKTAGDINKYSKNIFGLDEPETWLHPRAQIKLIEAVRGISKKQQVLLVTHSPYMLQNFSPDDSAVIIFGDNQNGGRTFAYTELNKCNLPYISWNAINYYVFGVPSVEFMDELYGHFQVKAKGKSLRENEMIKSLNEHGINSTENWIKEIVKEDGNGETVKEYKPFNVPLCVYVRNSVHHPENPENDKYTTDQLRKAIEELESAILSLPLKP